MRKSTENIWCIFSDQANRFSFTFFLGFDQGDALYDTGDAWTEMRQAFHGQ
jgi:hypothetical protein